MGKFTNKLDADLVRKHPDYQRQLMQTYLTAPEWRNVEMARELGQSLKKGTPFFRFPYFRQIGGFWQVFFQSYRAAKRHHTHRHILFSEYMVMNIFIGCSITIGHFAKGLVSLVLFPFLRKQNQTSFQRHLGKTVSEYGDFLQHTPFYNFPYLKRLKSTWQGFKASPNKSLIDYVTFFTAMSEFLVRQLISAPIAWWYNQPQNAAAEKIHIVVKSSKTTQQLKKISNKMTVIGKPLKKKGSSNKYYHLELPRYLEFQKIIEKFSTYQIKIKRIAGQKKIQVKVSASSKQYQKLDRKTILYDYQNHVDKHKFVELDVTTKALPSTIRKLKRNKIAIKLIHDF